MPSKFGGIAIDEPVVKTSKFGGVPWTAPDVQKAPVEPTAPEGISFVGEALETIKSIGKLYPVAETAATLATSAYGIPLSGLAGLLALPFGLEKAEKVVGGVQKALVAQPQTEAGKQLSGAVSYPFEQLERVAEYAGGEAEKAGYPMVGAAVHTAISAAPSIIGAKIAIGRSPMKAMAKIDTATKVAINKGLKKAVRPSVAKRKTAGQVSKYFDQARVAVEEIVSNKDNLTFIDDTGAQTKGLPKTLEQFSQSIEQTKRNIFNEYDSLAQQADVATPGAKPIRIDLGATSKKLNPIVNNKVLKDFSPETIEYAKQRQSTMTGAAEYTAVETQEAVQVLNQSLEQFYRNPSPGTKGQALVDSLIANDLRGQLDTTIRKATGKEYSALKRKYGALKTIERDVTRRSIVDARKNNKGLIDFSDIFAGHQVIKGLLAKDPAALAGGVATKGISKYYKMLNDPNRIVKNMFSEVEKLAGKKEIQRARIKE